MRPPPVRVVELGVAEPERHVVDRVRRVVEQDGVREIGREDWVVAVAVGRERGCDGRRASADSGGGRQREQWPAAAG